MCKVNRFKIKLDTGYLIVEEKGNIGNYPGVWISYDINGNPDDSILCACIEEDTANGRVLIETYDSEVEEPAFVYDFFNHEEV